METVYSQGLRCGVLLEHAHLAGLTESIRREMRNREVHTPPISAFRWWARRSHTVFGALVEAAEATMGNNLLIVDPFAGGGTTLLEAARRGHSVYGQDINPWAVRGIRAMLSLGAIEKRDLDAAVNTLAKRMEPVVRRAYYVNNAWTTHVFRVATSICPTCNETLWLYPYALLTLDSRRPGEDKAWYGCQRCGAITVGSRQDGATCSSCGMRMTSNQSYLPNREATCPHCGTVRRISSLATHTPLNYRIVLVERVRGGQRWFDLPNPEDLAREEGWDEPSLPVGEIPMGKETSVLRRHGIIEWKDLYPARQRAVLSRLLDEIARLPCNDSTRELLRVAAVGTAEMAGLSSRWDRFYLKAYEVTANHRYAFAPFTAEPNLWGETKRVGEGLLLGACVNSTRGCFGLQINTRANRVLCTTV